MFKLNLSRSTPFDELDKARLTKEFYDKGRYLNAGLIGTII